MGLASMVMGMEMLERRRLLVVGGSLMVLAEGMGGDREGMGRLMVVVGGGGSIEVSFRFLWVLKMGLAWLSRCVALLLVPSWPVHYLQESASIMRALT
jgi:hypothetical protein